MAIRLRNERVSGSLSMNRREFLPNAMTMKSNGLTPGPMECGVSQRINLLFIIDQLCETGGAERCLLNIRSALEQAGAGLKDVVRVTYILPNAAEFAQCWPVLRKYFGEIRPAATMLGAGLADPKMRIEIEVTARRRVATANGG